METMKAESQAREAMEALVPLAEAARVLHCHPRLVKALAERGEIPSMRMGNRWKFLPSMLDEWRRKKLLARMEKSATSV